MREGNEAAEEINTSFPQELLTNAIAKESFGGAFNFKKMNFLERMIVKKVAKIDKDTSNISSFIHSRIINNAVISTSESNSLSCCKALNIVTREWKEADPHHPQG